MGPGRIVVIGETDQIELYALAGAEVVVAADRESVQTAWASLPSDTELVLLTARTAALLQLESGGCEHPLVAVMDG